MNIINPEMQEKIDQWYVDFIAKEKEKNKQMKEIMTTTEYVEWLDSFTKNEEGFSDEDWVYNPEEISESDRKNVDKLGIFYEGLEIYASKNHIYPVPCKFGNFYKVRWNGFGFEVGILIGQGTVFFFNRSAIENEKEFMDFNDIMTDKVQDNVANINEKLTSLSQDVQDAYNSGVPLEAIMDTLEETVNRIAYENKEKVRMIERR